MSYELPRLDKRSYEQLLADLLRRIPAHTQRWTDYNDSDPGITLIQLLCWIDASLLYQANALPLQTQQNFLRWVLGLAHADDTTPYSQAAASQNDFAFQALQQVLAKIEAGAALSAPDLQREVLRYVHHPYLALSLEAVQALALEANAAIAAQQPTGKPLLVRRADAFVTDEATTVSLLSDAPWTYQSPKLLPPISATPSRRRVLLVQPQDLDTVQATLCAQVRRYLAPRVLAGSAVNVQIAPMTWIDLAVVVRCSPEASLDACLSVLVAALFQDFLPDRNPPWVYDEAPDPAQIQQQILRTAGVSAIERFELNYIPTLELDVLAQLGVNTLLADLPPGAPALQFRGLPRLRCLDVTVTQETGGAPA